MAKYISNLYLRWYFRNESEKARQIAIERPKCWEYLLSEQLLNDWLTKWMPAFHDEPSVKRSDRVFTNQIEFQFWAILQGMKVLNASCTAVVPFMNQELRAALGPQGVPGDAVGIRKAIVKLDKMALEMIDWQREIASAKFPIRRETIRELMMGWRKYPVELIEQFKRKLTTMLTDDPCRFGKSA